MDRISDNASIVKLSNQIKTLSQLGRFLRTFRYFGFRAEELRETVDSLMKLNNDIESVIGLPDIFNEYFSMVGWISYESFSSVTANRAIALAKENKFHEAEQLIANSFTNEDIETLIESLQQVSKFKCREGLARQAFTQYNLKEYHLCTLLLFTLIDGLTSDISHNNRGFFAEDTDLYAYDSIAGHSSSLKALSKLLSSTRTKTNEEPITIPFRNGIMHGKDLNYNNQLVAIKLWNSLFAIRDWYISRGRVINVVKEKTFREVIKELSQLRHKKRIASNWQPRNFSCHIDSSKLVSIDIESDDYYLCPEKSAVMMFQYWRVRNFKEIGLLLANFPSYKESRMAGEARRFFGETKLVDFHIFKVIDCNLSSSLVYAECTYEKGDTILTREFKIELLCAHGPDPVCRTDRKGKWVIFERSFINL